MNRWRIQKLWQTPSVSDVDHRSGSILHVTLWRFTGLSAVMIQDMNSRRIKDYEFNWDRMTSFEGDTGPYLQFAHARLCSIERKFLDSLSVNELPFRPELVKLVDHPKALDLILALAQYPDLIQSLPQRGFEPVNLVGYLMAVCHKVSGCLEDVWVMGQSRDVAESRYWLYSSARHVLTNGLKVLGLKPLERM
jgi:arginyl-tRNA synthetase